MGKKQFRFFQTAETGNRTPDSGVKGGGANHYPRAPALNEDGIVLSKNQYVHFGDIIVGLQLAMWNRNMEVAGKESSLLDVLI